jgi:hypothetical protein
MDDRAGLTVFLSNETPQNALTAKIKSGRGL